MKNVHLSKSMRKPSALAIGALALAAACLFSRPAVGSGPLDAAPDRFRTVAMSSEHLGWLRHVPESVHLVADVQIAVTDPSGNSPGWSTTGRFEFEREGESFRASATSDDPRTPLASDATVAWDGLTFQFWDHGSGSLHLTEGLPEVLPLAHPNPLLIPAVVSAGEAGREPVQWLPARAVQEERFLETLDRATAAHSVSRDVGRAPGSRSEVRFLAPESDPTSISRIEVRHPISGALEAELLLLDYRRVPVSLDARRGGGSASAWRFPHTLDLTGHLASDTAGGAANWHMRFVITKLEVGGDAPLERFDLLREAKGQVWDETGRRIR